MAVLNHLEPQRVFRFFEELCAIPHGSGNTKAVSDWLVDFAKARGLRYVQDQLNNVVIFRDATPGYESAEPVILQGHMDMVCEKEPGCTKDMAAEGLDLVLEGDTVSARGTTLGGDDGIAVAMAMAILDDESLSHPAIEAIFTVDEETGMYGAEGLDVSVLKGRRMLNMDSEDEGIFTVSCAGGARADCCLPVTRSAFSAPVLEISVTGLVGMIVLVPLIRTTFSLGSGACLLAAILVLSIMVLPSIINVSETALRAVPREYEEASLALGATAAETYFRVSLHAARSGVATAVVLGVGRAIGEAMAIIMVAGNVANMPGLFRSVRFLTTGIISGMSYAPVGSLYQQALFSIGLVLFLFIMLINVFLNVFIKKRKED